MTLNDELKETLEIWYEMYWDAHPEIMEVADLRDRLFLASADKLARNSETPDQIRADALDYLRQLAAG